MLDYWRNSAWANKSFPLSLSPGSTIFIIFEDHKFRRDEDKLQWREDNKRTKLY